MHAAIYVRISRDLEGSGLGVARQEEECVGLAERLGCTSMTVYGDNDTSAYSGKVRVEYRRMLTDIEAGKIDVVIAWHPDRLHRKTLELEEYIRVAESIPTHTVRAGRVDLSTPTGRAVAKTVGAWAQQESEHKADRLKAKHAQLREAGVMVGCRTFGWKVTSEGRLSPELDPPEAGMLREAAKAVIAGGSLFSIAKQWNADGWRTRRGGLWTHSNLRLALLNPKIAGLRAHKREVVTDAEGMPVVGQWQPILTVEEWQQVCALIASKKRTRSGSTKHLLGGLMTCGCGGVLYGSVGTDYRTKRPVANYSCRDCRAAINTDKADRAVVCAVVSSLLFGEAAPEAEEGAYAAQDARLSDLRAADARLLDLAAAGVYTTAETASKRAEIQAEIAAVRQEVATSTTQTAYSQQVRAIRASLWSRSKVKIGDAVKAKQTLTQSFENLEFDRKRALIRGSVSVTVLRGRADDRVKVWHLIATSLNDSDEIAAQA